MAIQISSNYYSAVADRRAKANGALFRQYKENLMQASSSTSGVFDYNAALKKTNSLVSEYKKQAEESVKLRKDSAEFLKTYTKNVKTMESAASAVRGANLDQLIGKVEDGKISQENLQKTTEAVQSMVDAYNTTLSTLNKNADRGVGVTQQIARMAADPTNQQTMDLIGVSVEKDGSLKLDSNKLSQALTSAAESDAKTGSFNQMNLIKDAIGGSTGLAAGIQFDARMGQSTPAASLISNDLAKLEQQSLNNPFSNLYGRGGSYSMMNMGAAGLLMNVMA